MTGRYDLNGFMGHTGLMIPRNPDGSPAMTFSQLIKEKMGLVLTPASLMVPILTIVHLEPPTPN